MVSSGLSYRPPKMSGRRISALVGINTPRPRKMTFPLAHSSRHKERRWPLVLRFTRGAIHQTIWAPVMFHSCFTALIVYLNAYISSDLSLPNNIIPSLSIVVGLMLVFRNQTAYSRMWDGRIQLNNIAVAVRCLSRSMLALSPAPPPPMFDAQPQQAMDASGVNHLVAPLAEDTVPQRSASIQDTYNLEKADAAYTEETIKILIALLPSIKTHLRTNWGVQLSPGTHSATSGQHFASEPSYGILLPPHTLSYEASGLSLPLQLLTMLEIYIDHGQAAGWFHNAASSTMLSEVHAITSSFTMMETIRLTPIPVMHVIHHRQTLALYCLLLPLSIVSEIGWFSIVLVAVVSFTLYGIEGIAQGFDDPFKRGKGDVDLDGVVEDCRGEIECMLNVWKTSRMGRADGAGETKRKGWMFRPTDGDRDEVDRPTTANSTKMTPAPLSPGGHLIPEININSSVTFADDWPGLSTTSQSVPQTTPASTSTSASTTSDRSPMAR